MTKQLAALRERVEGLRDDAQNAADNDLYRNQAYHEARVEAYDAVLALFDGDTPAHEDTDLDSWSGGFADNH